MLTALLSRGHFPKELPPPFRTLSLAAALQAPADLNAFVALIAELPPAKLASHNLARPGNIYRRLGLVNPAPYVQLAKLLTEKWPDLTTHFNSGTVSLSTPTSSRVGRAITAKVPLGELPVHRAATRAGRRYLLCSDITRFYPSVYTHSIPWALHGKAAAKANKTGALFGNTIDKRARHGQDAQTIGIPIGPDTSLVLGEIVMTAVDRELAAIPGGVGFRYLDDIELSFTTRADAEAAVGYVQEALGRFELALNPTKTSIRALPDKLDDPWLSVLKTYKFPSKPVRQRTALVDYFDRAFALAREHPTKTVLNYAVARLRGDALDERNADLVQQLILQSLVNEPGVTRFALEMLIRYKAAGWPLDKSLIADAIGTSLNTHAPLLHGSEVAWALWGSIALDIPVPSAGAAAALRMGDSIVDILCLEAHSRGLIGQDVRTTQAAALSGESFGSDRWLVLYESVRRNWLPRADVAADAFAPVLDYLIAHNVAFFEPDTELAKIQRPADQLHLRPFPVVGMVFEY